MPPQAYGTPRYLLASATTAAPAEPSPAPSEVVVPVAVVPVRPAEAAALDHAEEVAEARVADSIRIRFWISAMRPWTAVSPSMPPPLPAPWVVLRSGWTTGR